MPIAWQSAIHLLEQDRQQNLALSTRRARLTCCQGTPSTVTTPSSRRGFVAHEAREAELTVGAPVAPSKVPCAHPW